MTNRQEVLAVGVALLSFVAQAQIAPGTTSRASESTAGVPGDQDSIIPAISSDGRFVAFTSLAENLVPGDTNLSSDIFVRDRLLGTTERVSVSSRGREADGNSGFLNGLGGPSISGDGRFVAFDSEATNLVSGDANNTGDVFVHDRLTGTTTLISGARDGNKSGGGGTEPAISRDGRFVAFASFSDSFVPDNNFTGDIYVVELATGAIERISQAPDGADANSTSFGPPHLSADGRWVYFSSFASNLVAGDTDLSTVDAYLFDRQTRTMFAITSLLGTAEGNFTISHGIAGGISGDGRYLTFSSDDPTIGPPDANGFNTDAWVFDRVTGLYERVSVNDAEEQANELTFAGDISDDGTQVALTSRATNMGGPDNFRENIYLRNRAAGTTRLVSVANDGTFGDLFSVNPAMTPEAGVIAFQSPSSTFSPDGSFASQIYVRDLRAQADLHLTLTDSPDPVVARSPLTYSLTVLNQGPGTATSVTLTDVLPDVTFNSAASSSGSCVRGGKGKSNGTITCSLGTLAPGAAATVTIGVTPTRAGTLSNTASVKANEPDADTADNSALEATTVLAR